MVDPHDSNRLTLSGVVKLFDLVGIDVETVCFAYLMEWKCMYVITRGELCRVIERTTWNGFNSTVKTYKDLAELIPHLRIQLCNRDLYRVLFTTSSYR